MEAEDLGERMKRLQASNENKQRQLEEMRKVASAAPRGQKQKQKQRINSCDRVEMKEPVNFTTSSNKNKT